MNDRLAVVRCRYHRALRTISRVTAGCYEVTTGSFSFLWARVGPDRLGDGVLDLAPDALAAWLGNPAAS